MERFSIQVLTKTESRQTSDFAGLGIEVEESYDIEKVVSDVTSYVQTVIDEMDVEASISSSYNRRTINMQIDTNEPGRVIGYHGKVLKALQLLAQNYLTISILRISTLRLTLMIMLNTVQKSFKAMRKNWQVVL